ncbi:MAG: HNH endonuclease [Rhodoglobus sp.]
MHLIWTGPIQLDRHGLPGYGMAQYRGETVAAHRLAFAFASGGFPPKPFIVAHRCDRKLCCAPNCLLNSTQGENNRDQWRLKEVGNTWG